MPVLILGQPMPQPCPSIMACLSWVRPGSLRRERKKHFCCLWHLPGCVPSSSSEALTIVRAGTFHPAFHTVLLAGTKRPELDWNSAKLALRGLAGALGSHPKRDVHRERPAMVSSLSAVTNQAS